VGDSVPEDFDRLVAPHSYDQTNDAPFARYSQPNPAPRFPGRYFPKANFAPKATLAAVAVAVAAVAPVFPVESAMANLVKAYLKTSTK
jgi:hypothetical protein